MKFKNLREIVLVWFMCLVFLHIAVFLVLESYYFDHSFRALTYSKLEELASKQRNFIDYWLQEKHNNIKILAQSQSVWKENRSEMEKEFRLILSTHLDYTSIAFINEKGIIVLNPKHKEGIDVADRPYYQAAKKGKDYISGVVIARDTKKPVIVFSVPVWKNNSFRGAIIGTVSLDRIERIMQSKDKASGENSYLLDQKGGFIVPYPSETDTFNMKPFYSKEVALYKNYQGKEVLGALAKVSQKNWFVLVEKDKGKVLASLFSYYKVTLIGFGVLAWLFFFFLNTFLVQRVANPLKELAQMVSEIAAGNFSMRAHNYPYGNEIEILTNSFNKMADSLEKQQKINKQIMEKLNKRSERWKKIAITDGLTGLYNKRYLQTCLEREFHHAARFFQPLSLIMLDIDFFKKVNDTYGHQVGDEVLKELAKVLVDSIRKLDIAVRYGGEEFTLVCPVTTLEAAKSLAERIRKKIESHDFITSAGILNITISLGVASLKEIKDSTLDQQSQEFIARADAALYQAKAKGRNRVEIA